MRIIKKIFFNKFNLVGPLFRGPRTLGFSVKQAFQPFGVEPHHQSRIICNVTLLSRDRPRSGHVKPAIHLDHLSGDEARHLRGCQEKIGPNAFLNGADPPHGRELD